MFAVIQSFCGFCLHLPPNIYFKNVWIAGVIATTLCNFKAKVISYIILTYCGYLENIITKNSFIAKITFYYFKNGLYITLVFNDSINILFDYIFNIIFTLEFKFQKLATFCLCKHRKYQNGSHNVYPPCLTYL